MRKKEDNSAKYEYHFLTDEDKKELADKYGYEKPEHKDIPGEKRRQRIGTIIGIVVVCVVRAALEVYEINLGLIPNILIIGLVVFLIYKIVKKKEE